MDLSGGAQLLYRQDFGDAMTGGGLELGTTFKLELPNSGLHVDLATHTLLNHSSDIQEWGANLGFSWAAGEDGRGLALSLQPQMGQHQQPGPAILGFSRRQLRCRPNPRGPHRPDTIWN